MSLEEIYKKAEEYQNKPVAPVPEEPEASVEMVEDSKKQVEDIPEEGTPAVEAEGEPQGVVSNEEGVEAESDENAKTPLTVEDKLKKRINKITAEKKATQETSEEVIAELRRENESLKQQKPSSSETAEVKDGAYTLKDVESEISRIETLINQGDLDEDLSDGSGSHNLNVYLNKLTREHNRLYVEDQRSSVESNMSRLDKQQQQIQQEVVDVETRVKSLTGVSNVEDLKQHPMVKIMKTLVTNDPQKYNIKQAGGWTDAYYDALEICMKDGLLNNKAPLNINNKQKRKSSIIPGNIGGSPTSEAIETNPVLKNENENKSYVEQMINDQRKKRGLI